MSTITPDQVLDGPPAAPDDTPGATKPDLCPYCGAHYQEGPEAADWAKHYHCWRCGFDPGRVPTGIAHSGPAFGGAIPAQFAQQLAAEVHAALGLAPGENLGDVIAAIRATQPAVAEGS